MSDLIARLLNPAYECLLGVTRLAEKQTRQDMDEAANRIKELEAELERARKANIELMKRRERAEAERDRLLALLSEYDDPPNSGRDKSEI